MKKDFNQKKRMDIKYRCSDEYNRRRKNHAERYGVSHLSAGEAKVSSSSTFTVGEFTIELKEIEEKNNVQNKLHYAITGMTAPEIIYNRVDSKKEYMGLQTWKNSPDGKILETDVVVAKNYLFEEELKELNNLVSMYLDFAERQVKLGHIISMQEWKDKLEMFLNLNEYNILKDNGKIKREIADKLALEEYEKYRIVQDQNYISDFDELLLETKNIESNNDI